jgi:adenylate cyclase
MERRLAAIFAADVVGYSRLIGADEEGTLERLKAHRRELIDPKIAEHQGRIVKTMGDGVLVEFASPVKAVRCAIEVQHGMVDRNADVPQERRIEFRIGINLGDVIVEEGDISGDGVNVAARLESIAEPGAVYISRAVRDLVRDKPEIKLEDLGEKPLKNIAKPVRVFRIGAPDRAAGAPQAAAPSAASLRRRVWRRPGVGSRTAHSRAGTSTASSPTRSTCLLRPLVDLLRSLHRLHPAALEIIEPPAPIDG